MIEKRVLERERQKTQAEIKRWESLLFNVRNYHFRVTLSKTIAHLKKERDQLGEEIELIDRGDHSILIF